MLSLFESEISNKLDSIKTEIASCQRFLNVAQTLGHFYLKRVIYNNSKARRTVLEVFDSKNIRTVALKIQPSSKLVDMEVAALKMFQCSKYSPRFYGSDVYKSNHGIYSVICLELLDKDLHDYYLSLRENGQWKQSLVFLNSLQEFLALKDLHNIGLIHCDIKPINFAVTTNGCKPKVHLIDLGLARKYLTATGEHYDPKGETTNYLIGTVRYASLSAHHFQSLSRRDDLMSHFYSMVENCTGPLPWAEFDDDPTEACRSKMRCNVYDMLQEKKLPATMADFYRHISSLSFNEKPDYNYLYRCLKDCLKESLLKENGPNFDWTHYLENEMSCSE